MAQNQANCHEFPRIAANSRQFGAEKLALFDQEAEAARAAGTAAADVAPPPCTYVFVFENEHRNEEAAERNHHAKVAAAGAIRAGPKVLTQNEPNCGGFWRIYASL